MDMYEPEKHLTKTDPQVSQMRESVLLLDDVDDLRFVLTEVLEHLGYDVIACDGGRAALRFLESSPRLPSFIICDISMPDMDGYTFFRELRGNPVWSDIYFIFMSGSRDDRRAALEHGADDYVAKPFPITDLQVVLEKYRAWRSARDEHP
jgi:CheY-like chemotaxis protein